MLLLPWYKKLKKKIKDLDFDNILINGKPYRIILDYEILYKTFIGAKPLGIWFYKVDRFIRIYDETRYLILFGPEKYHAIFNRISILWDRYRYLIRVKCGITYVISYNYAKIKVDSCDSFPLEKTLIFHDVIILIMSKDKNIYYYNTT